MSGNVERLCRAIDDKDEATWRQLLGEMSSREMNNGDEVDGDTPLHASCYSNNVPAAAALLQTPGIEVNIKNRYGITPIMEAVRWCYKEVVEVMVRDGRVELAEGLEEQGRWGGSDGREIVRLIQEERRRREERRQPSVEDEEEVEDVETVQQQIQETVGRKVSESIETVNRSIRKREVIMLREREQGQREMKEMKERQEREMIQMREKLERKMREKHIGEEAQLEKRLKTQEEAKNLAVSSVPSGV